MNVISFKLIKTRAEVEQELTKVRDLLARADDEEDGDMLYGAQQALGWVLGELGSMSELEKTIQRIASAL